MQVKRSYITFESEEGFLRCLKYYHSHALVSFFDREDLRLDGKRLKVLPAEVWKTHACRQCRALLNGSVLPGSE